MAGRIKSGEGTLIGNAGEYYVVAELLKRGIIATLAPRNMPSFDILATKYKTIPRNSVHIRVKTKSEKYDLWRWNAKQDGSIFPYLHTENDFTVLVNLTDNTKHMDYFIIATHELDNWLQADFQKWLDKPGRNGRQHSETNRVRGLSYFIYKAQLEPYCNNWDVLWA